MLWWHQFLNKSRKYGPGRACVYAAQAVARPWQMRFWDRPVLHSYASHREDLIIDDLLGHPQRGAYVDIGAHDPVFISNTKFFYDRGWSGWNIEPDPDRSKVLAAARPRDITLTLAVSKAEGQLTFYRCRESQMSTLDPVRAREITRLGGRIAEEIPVRTLPLQRLVSEFKLPATPEFLNIDVEGMELDVLQGNDWSLFRPKVICVEVSEIDILKPAGRMPAIEDFLSRQDYERAHLTRNLGEPLNAIFCRR